MDGKGGGGLDTHVCDEMMMRVSLGVCVVFVVVGGVRRECEQSNLLLEDRFKCRGHHAYVFLGNLTTPSDDTYIRLMAIHNQR